MRILFLGDIVGRPGRLAVRESMYSLLSSFAYDYALANAENVAGGLGLKPRHARDLLASGLDALTTGNHVFKHREIYEELTVNPRLVRPANYPGAAPGEGLRVLEATESRPALAVVNLLGRTYMEALDCPFATADALLAQIPADVKLIFVDFHAEATSEKRAMGYYLDGRVSVVAGTHTHVQTSDACLLPQGTAYITDAGMCGVSESILGMDPKAVVRRFVTGMPHRFTLAKGDTRLEGVVADLDPETGLATAIRAFRHQVDAPHDSTAKEISA